MKILVFGKTGQVATCLQEQADVIALGRDQADLTDVAAIKDIVDNTDADVIINAAAYTAVDKAENSVPAHLDRLRLSRRRHGTLEHRRQDGAFGRLRRNKADGRRGDPHRQRALCNPAHLLGVFRPRQ